MLYILMTKLLYRNLDIGFNVKVYHEIDNDS